MRRKVSSVKNRASAVETRDMTDLNEWEQVGHFNSYLILGKGDLRCIIDTITGRVIVQYKFKKAREGDTNAGL